MRPRSGEGARRVVTYSTADRLTFFCARSWFAYLPDTLTH
jgi:hypothetical protein